MFLCVTLLEHTVSVGVNLWLACKLWWVNSLPVAANDPNFLTSANLTKRCQIRAMSVKTRAGGIHIATMAYRMHLHAA